MEQDQRQDNPLDSSIPSSSTMTEEPVPSIELGLIPFIPSREQVVENLDTIFFNLEKNMIVRRKEKRVKMGDQPMAVMVTEETVMQRLLIKTHDFLQWKVY